MSNTVCVIGLGYVGLPLAIAFDNAGVETIGFDIDEEKVSTLSQGADPTDEVRDAAIANSTVTFSSNASVIEEATHVLVTVPTPIDELKNPNLEHVTSAGELIGEHITRGTTVVLESTVYPGATREILAPAIEKTSGLTVGEGFHIAYSPERMVPGDEDHSLANVVKIVSGESEDVLVDVTSLYEEVVDAGIHQAPEIEVAEAAKCIENIQRDLNIALVNELAVACESMDLDTHDVLDAAATKWNFHEYHPGLVGGHCIPVDPFYIIYESERNGFQPRLINQAREVNEYMPEFVAEQTIHALNDHGNVLRDSTVLVLGLAYKPGVNDLRTSAIGGTIEKLHSFDVEVVGWEPYADDEMVRDEFGIEPVSTAVADADAVILATPHEEFLDVDFPARYGGTGTTIPLVDVVGALNKAAFDGSDVEYVRI
ncbi:nucleotide sugar dehydrogenase [Halobacterium hubeiense]|uniref:nucleotide sugar dehydrogenase n=1 Tax=Halobacterium hubeiense TaxID=1407499 RepID=UPI003C717943